jgi:hypothetical protein
LVSSRVGGLIDRLDDLRAKGEVMRHIAVTGEKGDGFHHALQNFNEAARKSFEVSDPRKKVGRRQ